MAPEIASHHETQNGPPLTLGSLLDGIGVFPLAASRHGIVPLWASEIEKAPISITRRHFPEMAHLGDITKMDGGQIPAVHILTFGSPCQNLSQIGDRSGLAGAKSSLFHHAIRIIKEMRCATGGQFPIIALWEVVTPFAFWFEDDPFGGCIRFPTERETERMMGLPEGWTEYGADGKPISSTQRYRALGNSIALPCADYLMAGIAEVLGKDKIASHRETQNGR